MGPVRNEYVSSPRIEHRFHGHLALVVICQACRIKKLIEAEPISIRKSNYFLEKLVIIHMAVVLYISHCFKIFSSTVLENGSVRLIKFGDGRIAIRLCPLESYNPDQSIIW
jgi:hypothetical protein